ncbi:MAG: reverse transcriptase domain-containing protein [Cetobacterium sp.]
MALLQLVDKICTALDNNMFAISIFLDFSKTFDTVYYIILISKLHRFQDVVIYWLSDYLKNRDQCVSINGCISNRIKLYCKVPQGSILGPLLFLI